MGDVARVRRSWACSYDNASTWVSKVLSSKSGKSGKSGKSSKPEQNHNGVECSQLRRSK
jgi:hypothetical protein